MDVLGNLPPKNYSFYNNIRNLNSYEEFLNYDNLKSDSLEDSIIDKVNFKLFIKIMNIFNLLIDKNIHLKSPIFKFLKNFYINDNSISEINRLNLFDEEFYRRNIIIKVL